MRPALGAIALVAAAACEPEIGAGTYFCGEGMFCPPDLACDPSTFTCENPGAVRPFECPEGSEPAVPDDTADEARELGRVMCNDNTNLGTLCLPDPSDVDMVTFEIGECMIGEDPHVEVEMRFPLALAPVEIDILDDAEAVVAQGTPCTPDVNNTGMEWSCARIPGEPGTYFIRVRLRGDFDCDGQCPFNLYQLYVRYPLS